MIECIETCEHMQSVFPDYPCGRENCRFKGDSEKANACICTVQCQLFDAWFSEHWHRIQKKTHNTCATDIEYPKSTNWGEINADN